MSSYIYLSQCLETLCSRSRINIPLLNSTICLDINDVSDSIDLLETVPLLEANSGPTHLYWRKYVDNLIIPFSLKPLHCIRILQNFHGAATYLLNA
jgi:hypothetical protein